MSPVPYHSETLPSQSKNAPAAQPKPPIPSKSCLRRYQGMDVGIVIM